MGVPVAVKQRRLRGPARREQLLDTAAELLEGDGFAALTVEAIAKQAGVTRAVIYQHFADLTALLGALLDRETAKTAAQVSLTTPTDFGKDAPRDVLLAHLGEFLHAVAADPRTWRLVLTPPDGAPALLRERIEAGREHVRLRLAAALSAHVPDPDVTGRVLAAMSDEYARLLLDEPLRYPPARLLEHARSWLDGLIGPTASG